jgi:phosphate acetyltransferase
MQSIDPTKVIESEIFDELDVGDTITVSVGVPAKDGLRRQITFVCSGIDQRVGEVIEGMAMDMASAENTKPSPVDVPEQHLREHEIFFRTILERTRGLEPLRIAVVHPVDRNALLGAVEAAQAELILPTFVGPEDRIRATAQAELIDISPYALVSTEHSHAAAARSVAMARSGEVDALMKGSLHTDELMHEVVAPDTGLTTDRRMSHVFVLDVPTYPRPLFITDAALNVDPDLDAKRDIVQNAIELAQALGITTPKVAILSAVETVTPKLRSTLDAAALAKMADRGQIVGGVVDGPLAFDNSVSPDAAKVKGIVSPVAGQADILVVPNLESGNMLTKQLEYLADSQAVGIVLGGRVPIVLTSRADSPQEHMVSCALALLMARKSTRTEVVL